MASLPSVGDLVPQLAGLSPIPPGHRAPGLGGQNFTHCCLLAVNESLAVGSDGNLTYTATPFVAPGVPIGALGGDGGQFPCGASFDGDVGGAPPVRVPYDWCAARCGGWEMSRPGATQQWVGPLVQFIVPSLAFCTNVPRTRKLAIPDVVFRGRPRSPAGFASYWLRLLGAFLLVTADTFVWLAICFAFAGPMLLSAVYEYALDRRVLEFLAAPPETRPAAVPSRLRAHLLLAVVVGNLRMATLETHDVERAGPRTRRHDSVVSDDSELTTAPVNSRKIGEVVHNTIWKRVTAIVEEYEAARLADREDEPVVSLPTKLKSLLNSQASFGSTIGGPTLFFIGGFIYTVLDVENNLGDNDTAHALAFGLWWMVIPYLAIISCAMLASNGTSALNGIVYDGSTVTRPDEYEPSFWAQQIKKAEAYPVLGWAIRQVEGYSPIETASEGRFQTVKLWKRGLNKQEWVQEAIRDYEHSASEGAPGDRLSPSDLRRSLQLNRRDVLYVLFGAAFAVLVPCCLAFLTSYNTPQAGLSCRSLTYLVYAVSQACEMALWASAARLRVRHGARWSEACPTSKKVAWWGQVFVGFFSIFAAAGGTVMQLLGVFRSCTCKVPVRYWPRLHDPSAYIVLSDNTAEDIAAAQHWWTATGTTAVIVIGIVCALAWWHQRRLRKVFRDEADRLETDAW
ncbi:hypothetical protein GGS23DRAFT_611828 [Durotheca rogersii]|uniref:uncharacterized protein n=1 Tax=Durotheca rogersii TaxID=419775 RepID=UPI002220DD11|nr:uncharacterized protein GGS23DRAFT_611828 [Durotheca rogersii]KAI5861680.1 hypothetical protein GGS23DRAFT_611828 [Durotheca rogersii]